MRLDHLLSKGFIAGLVPGGLLCSRSVWGRLPGRARRSAVVVRDRWPVPPCRGSLFVGAGVWVVVGLVPCTVVVRGWHAVGVWGSAPSGLAFWGLLPCGGWVAGGCGWVGCELYSGREHLTVRFLRQSVSCFVRVSLLFVFLSVRWMPWHQGPMKDVVACDIPRGAGWRAVIRGFPNGGTRHELCRVTCI